MFLTAVNVGTFSLGAIIVSLFRVFSLSPFFSLRRGSPGLVSLTMVTVRVGTLFFGNSDKQGRHKLKRKLFVRRQFEIFILSTLPCTL